MSSLSEPHQSQPHPLLRLLFGIELLMGLAGVGLVIWAVTRASEPPETAIRKLLDDQVADWNGGNLDGFMTGYWKSDDMSFYAGKDKQRGWQETMNRYRNRYQGAGKEMGTVAFDEVDIQMLGPDAALVRGRWQVRMKDKTPSGLFTLVVQRFPEGWRIVHDHTSD